MNCSYSWMDIHPNTVLYETLIVNVIWLIYLGFNCTNTLSVMGYWWTTVLSI